MISGEDYRMHIFYRQEKIFLLMQDFQPQFITGVIILQGAVLPDQIDPLGGVSYPSSELLAKSGTILFLILEQVFCLFQEKFLVDFQ